MGSAPGDGPAIAVSARDFLVRGRNEAPGYGLYSYLLFPVNDAANRPRYAAALLALVGRIDTRPAVEAAGFKAREINLTYVPVTEAVPEGTTIDWLIDRHDFARAKRILGFVGVEPIGGPFLVSYLEPLLRRSTAREKVLVQDLSRVPPEMVSLWVGAFTQDVREPRFWDRTHLSGFMLEMRTALAIIAEPFGLGVQAAEQFIEFKDALGGG